MSGGSKGKRRLLTNPTVAPTATPTASPLLACGDAVAPAHGSLGSCPGTNSSASIPHGTSCVPTCESGYQVKGMTRRRGTGTTAVNTTAYALCVNGTILGNKCEPIPLDPPVFITGIGSVQICRMAPRMLIKVVARKEYSGSTAIFRTALINTDQGSKYFRALYQEDTKSSGWKYKQKYRISPFNITQNNVTGGDLNRMNEGEALWVRYNCTLGMSNCMNWTSSDNFTEAISYKTGTAGVR